MPRHTERRLAARAAALLAVMVATACEDVGDNVDGGSDASAAVVDGGLPGLDANFGLDAAVWDANGSSFDGATIDSGAWPGGDAGGAADANHGDASSGDAATDGGVDGGLDSGPEPIREHVVALPDGPTYMGTKGSSSACSQSYHTTGFVPNDAAQKHPLFLYFAGTAGGAADNSALYASRAASRVNQAMAARGFVALAVEYDNALGSFFTNKQPCLFGSDNTQSLIARACALPSVDCGLGIATWGHSQGALLAHAASNFEPRVLAVWTTGYSGLTGAALPFNRLRTVNGEGDSMNSAVATANRTVGLTPAEQCPSDGRHQCLRSDGSGWIIVRKSACKLGAADHCWFNKSSCASNDETLEPNWVDLAATTPFALEANAEWVAQTVRR